MQDFVYSIEDDRLRDRLARAIQGRGAFGRFKNITSQNDALKAEWFAFKEARLLKRVENWLELEEIEADWLWNVSLPHPPIFPDDT